MAKILLFIIFSFITLTANENYVEIYRNSGIEKVKNIFDNLLESEKYWKNYLSDYNTSYGYYDNDRYLILCSKADKNMDVYHLNKTGKIDKIFSKHIILGKDGEKEKEGDLVTPIGVYTITSKFKPKNSFYGPIAFSLSYPNLYDKLQGRDGHGIWIHGYPLDDEKRDNVTKGCMVLKNEQLEELSQLIVPSKSFVMIYEKQFPYAEEEDIAKLLSFLYSWKKSWANNDLNRYLSFYDKTFKRYDGKNFKQFSNMKKAIFSRNEKKSILFSHISIIPYPNISDKKLFLIRFYEKYRAKHYAFNGNKILYVTLSDSAKIIFEK